MVYHPDIDEAMDEINKAMHLLRWNADSDSIQFWKALLEVNRALAMENTGKARRYLTDLINAFELSGRSEFPDAYANLRSAYEHMNKIARKPEEVHSTIPGREKYPAAP